MLESGKLCCTLQKFSLEVMQGSMTLIPTFPVDFPPNLYKLNTHYPHIPLHHIPYHHLPYSFFVILPIMVHGGQPWATCNPPSPWPPDLIAFICHPPTHPSPHATPSPMLPHPLCHPYFHVRLQQNIKLMLVI